MTPATGQLKWWGKSYSVRVRFGDGKRRWVALPEGIAHKEAAARARELAEAAKNETSVDALRAIVQPAETVEAWVERWLKWRTSRGLESVRDDRSRLFTHVLPMLGHYPMNAVTSAHLEDVRDVLDAKVQEGVISWKTAQHVWTAVRSVFRDARLAKRRDLRVRKDDPCLDLAPPDRGIEKSKQFLFPNELLQLVSCTDVPLKWRVVITLSVYLVLRAAELEALSWDDFTENADGSLLVHVHRRLKRYSHEEKATKTGMPRRFAVEPSVVPLIEALRKETGGVGRVLPKGHMPDKFELATGLRVWLAAAGVTRPELFVNDRTRKWITFHDLRATGITWMAVRGDDPLRIKQRAGHKSLSTTEGYIRTAEELRPGFGSVFPPLPASLGAFAEAKAA